MRIWHVTVQNMEDTYALARDDPYGRIACKFVITATTVKGLTPVEFETAMSIELTQAIRQIKKEMIMQGMEP
jgi:hypothetical protein